MRASIDKQRDMARSILPSRSRSSRADIAAVKRRHRASVRRDLRGLTTDGYLDGDFDLGRTCDREVNQLRRWRREADKLNHFERWAVRVTADLPIEDRRSHLRAILPDGLIGEHAMSHLERLSEIRPARPLDRLELLPLWDPKDVIRRRHARRDLRAAALRDLLAAGDGHAVLNRALREAEGPDDAPGRRLLGRHDVDAFAAHVWPVPPFAFAWREPTPGPGAAVVEAVLDELVPGWRDRG